VIAFLANIVIAIAKLIAGLASRSTGMLAEAAHSAADSVNEVFLAVGLYREFLRCLASGYPPRGIFPIHLSALVLAYRVFPQPVKLGIRHAQVKMISV
jgi:hypothetical protein